MDSMQCYKNTEKGLNQGYYGGSSSGQNANWGSKANKKENKYQGPPNGYVMAYSGSECYSQSHHPTHGMSKSQTTYGMAETWDEYGRSCGSQKFQNGNAMSKTQVHGRGNGFDKHSSNGISQIQAHGSSNHTSPGKRQGHGYDYGGSAPRNQKSSGGMGHGFNNHTNYEITEAYGYDEPNGSGTYTNNGMAHNQAHLRGKHSGQGNGFIKTQSYVPGKNMGYEISKTETYYSNESHQYRGADGYRAGKGDHSVKGLLRKIKDGISGNNRCSDTESDSDNDNDYGMRKVWISKAI
ncbi:hypothetical protein CRYUN_Cryun07bG0143500 [Craigia yunnanensis]